MPVQSIAILIQAFAVPGELIGACRLDQPGKTLRQGEKCGGSLLRTLLSRRQPGLNDAASRLKVIVRLGGAWRRSSRFPALEPGGPFGLLVAARS